MIVGTLNVKYSPNLGDGLLAECLEAELRSARPGVETRSIDLAGRTAYGEGLKHRRAILARTGHGHSLSGQPDPPSVV